MSLGQNGAGERGRPGPWILWTAVAAAVVLLTILERCSETTDETRHPVTLADASLEVLLWSSPPRVPKAGAVTFFARLVNRGDTEVAIRFEDARLAGGFRPGPCWVGGPACPEGGGAWPRTIPGGKAVVVRGQLTRTVAEEPPPLIVATLVWKPGPGSERRLTTTWEVQAGPTVYESWLRALQRTLKDYGLPLALAILAAVFDQVKRREEKQTKLREQEREQARAEAQTKLERVRAATEREQESFRATLSQMLPKVHANNERHYLPIYNDVDEVISYIAKLPVVPDSKSETVGRFLFHLVRSRSRMRRMSTAIGGFYLRTQLGEKLVSRSWYAAWTAVELSMAGLAEGEWDLLVDRVVGAVKTAMTFSEFEALRLGSDGGDLKKMEASLAVLLTQSDAEGAAARDLVRAFFGIFNSGLKYEMNAGYEYWYKDEAVFEADALETIKQDLDTVTRLQTSGLWSRYRKDSESRPDAKQYDILILANTFCRQLEAVQRVRA